MALELNSTGSGRSYYDSRYWQFSNTLTYLKTIKDIHTFSVMAGFEESKSTYNGF